MKLSKKFKVKIKARILMILSIFTALSLTLAVDKLTNEQESMIGQIESYMNGEEAIEIASVSSSSLTSKDITTPCLSEKNTYIKTTENIDINVLDADTNTVLGDQADFAWSSSNEEVATVDSNGVVTGKGIGHTTITAYNSSTGLKGKTIINVYRNQEGAITVPQVEAGEGFTVVLKEDGTVWTSGLNNYGQLGVGDTTNQNMPVQVKIHENTYLTNVRKISAGAHNVVAMTVEGEVYAWGINDAGQLGQGDVNNRLYATKVKGIDENEYIENIIDIACGGDVVALLDKTGSTYGIGSNFYQSINEIGTGNKTYPTKVTNMDNVIQVTSSYNAIGVLKQSGEAWIKGQNNYGSFGNGTIANWPTPGGLYRIGTDINEFKLLAYCGYILKEDGTLWSSGLNNYGQLGVGDTTDRTTYTQVVFENKEPVKAKLIAGQGRNLQFIGEDGKVYVTGHNEFGQVSNGTNTNASYPTPMKNADGTEVTDAVLLISGICAWDSKPRNMGIIRKDGTVWISGDNTYGQIGNGTNTSSVFLAKLGIKTDAEILLNKRNEYIKINESTDMDIEILKMEELEFNVFIQEKEAINQGNWTWSSSNEEVATVDSNGVVIGKGIGRTTITAYNSTTALKAKAIINVYRNQEGAITVPQVEIGEGYTIILKEDGTVWATGRNNVGQLGVGDNIDRNKPVQVKIDENTCLTNVRKISTGYGHVAAMTVDGEAYAWGLNDNGQLGQGNQTNQSYATRIKGENGSEEIGNIIDIVAGDLMIYLLQEDGNTLGIGNNAYHQIDEKDKSNKLYPTKVTNMDKAIKIETGNSNIAVIKSNGETWIKGDNDIGGFGNGMATPGLPGGTYLVGTDINEIQLSVSGYVLKENGTVWSTGYNNFGQLGLGDTSDRRTYTQVIFENKEPVKARTIKSKIGSQSFQFIGEDGKVYVTGFNGYGQLSNGTSTNTSYPIAMLNKDNTEVDDAISLTVGTCAWDASKGRTRNIGIIRKDGTVWLAGDNTYGQMGNGTNNSSSYLIGVGASLKYSEQTIKVSIGEHKKIEKLLFERQNIINVFMNKSTVVGELIYEIEEEEIASVTSLGMIEGKKQGITRVKVTDSNTKASTYIEIEVFDVNLKSVIVNDIELQSEETDKYTYKMTIKRTDTKAKVKIVTESPSATIKIGNYEAQEGESEQWVDLNLEEEVIQIPVIVTSKYGERVSRAIYKIVLTRESNDTSAVVSYDGTELTKAEDGKYKVSVLDTATSGKIKVVTSHEKAKVDIGNTTQYEENAKEYTVSINSNVTQKTIEIPITVMAEDGTVEESAIMITIIATNTNTAKVEATFEADGKEMTKQATIDEEGKYLIGVKQTTKEIVLKITAESQYATITRGTELGKGELITHVTLENDITYVDYEVTAEDGKTKVQKTIKIVKQSSDANIRNIVVEGKEAIIDEQGIYHASVEGGSTGAKVIITANSNVATIGISGIANPNTNKGRLDTIVGINTIPNTTYIITVTAEDETVKIYTLIITKQTNIAGKIITENIEGKHKSLVTVYKTSDKRPETKETNDEITQIRKVIASQETEEDGTFTIQVEDIESYDILVTKLGYLDYRVTEIEVEKGAKTTLTEYKLMAGDVVKSGQIEIDDLVALNDNFGVVITDANREQKAIYDLNEDGKVDDLDREILRKNYGKKNKLEQWEDPKKIRRMRTRRVETLPENPQNFILPIKGKYQITSDYGTRTHPVTGVVKKHTGIDLGGEHRTEIYAVADGEVVFAGAQNAFGNCIEIKHEIDGEIIYSFYAHLSRIDVKVGQEIKQEEVIGLEGGDPNTDPNPGSSTGHHLHFELRSKSGYGNDVNPRDYIEF